MQRSAVTSNRIKSQSKSQLALLWFFTVAWNALTWFAIIMGGDNILRAFEHNPLFYIFALFPFIGLLMLMSTIRQTLAWLRFGATPLSLDPFPAHVGGKVGGSLLLPVAVEGAVEAELRLTCFHRYLRRSGNESHWAKDPVWQDVQTVRVQRLGQQSRVTFDFATPAELPASSDEGDDQHLWELLVKIERQGLDFERVFEVPLQPATERTASRRQERTLQQSRHQAVHFEVPHIQSGAQGLELVYGYGRHKTIAIILFAVALFIGLFGWFFFQDFSSFLPVTSLVMQVYVLAIAAALLLFSLALMGQKKIITVNRDGIRKQQQFFGFSFTEHFPSADIADIESERSGSISSGNGTRVWFSLKLRLQDGVSVEVGDSLQGQTVVDQVRKTMIEALGRQWRPSTVTADKERKLPLPVWLHRFKWLAKLVAYALPLAVVYDLLTLFNFFSSKP